jgi:predicted DNA-binding protein
MVSRSPVRGNVEALGLRITQRLKAALRRLAEAENRTLSSYVEMALERHVAEVKPNSRQKRHT